MTNHEKAFRKAHPRATIESQITNGGKRYYLVRCSMRNVMYAGSGDTRSKAWKDAASKLELRP